MQPILPLPNGQMEARLILQVELPELDPFPRTLSSNPSNADLISPSTIQRARLTKRLSDQCM